MQHRQEHFDLVGACATFAAAAGRLVPALQGHRFTDAERERVHANLLRVRRSADWIATAAPGC